MDQSKPKTQKVMNLDCCRLKIEIIHDFRKTDTEPWIMYQKGYRHVSDCPWPVRFRKKIKTFKYLTDALDWLQEYIRTGSWEAFHDKQSREVKS